MVTNRILRPSHIPEETFRKVLEAGHSINSATRLLKVNAERLTKYLKMYRPNYNIIFGINGRNRQANSNPYKLAVMDNRPKGEMNHA